MFICLTWTYVHPVICFQEILHVEMLYNCSDDKSSDSHAPYIIHEHSTYSFTMHLPYCLEYKSHFFGPDFTCKTRGATYTWGLEIPSFHVYNTL